MIDGKIILKSVQFQNKLNTIKSNLTHKFLFQTPHVPPQCLHCGGVLTVKRFMVECPRFTHLRRKFEISDNIIEALGEFLNLEKTISYLKDIDFYNDI